MGRKPLPPEEKKARKAEAKRKYYQKNKEAIKQKYQEDKEAIKQKYQNDPMVLAKKAKREREQEMRIVDVMVQIYDLAVAVSQRSFANNKLCLSTYADEAFWKSGKDEYKELYVKATQILNKYGSANTYNPNGKEMLLFTQPANVLRKYVKTNLLINKKGDRGEYVDYPLIETALDFLEGVHALHYIGDYTFASNINEVEMGTEENGKEYTKFSRAMKAYAVIPDHRFMLELGARPSGMNADIATEFYWNLKEEGIERKKLTSFDRYVLNSKTISIIKEEVDRYNNNLRLEYTDNPKERGYYDYVQFLDEEDEDGDLMHRRWYSRLCSTINREHDPSNFSRDGALAKCFGKIRVDSIMGHHHDMNACFFRNIYDLQAMLYGEDVFPLDVDLYYYLFEMRYPRKFTEEEFRNKTIFHEGEKRVTMRQIVKQEALPLLMSPESVWWRARAEETQRSIIGLNKAYYDVITAPALTEFKENVGVTWYKFIYSLRDAIFELYEVKPEEIKYNDDGDRCEWIAFLPKKHWFLFEAYLYAKMHETFLSCDVQARNVYDDWHFDIDVTPEEFYGIYYLAMADLVELLTADDTDLDIYNIYNYKYDNDYKRIR